MESESIVAEHRAAAACPTCGKEKMFDHLGGLDPIPTTLSDQLRQLGLVHTASELNDFIARATQKRWSPVVQLERLVQAELEARLRHRVERRLRDARLGPLQADGRLGMGRGRTRSIGRPSSASSPSTSSRNAKT